MSFENLEKKFNEILNEFPDKREELLEDVSNDLMNSVYSNISKKITEHSGEFRKSVYKVKKIGYVAIRSKSGIKALLEYGHRNLSRGPKRKQQPVSKGLKFVPGKHIFRDAYLENIESISEKAQKIKNEIIDTMNKR